MTKKRVTNSDLMDAIGRLCELVDTLIAKLDLARTNPFTPPPRKPPGSNIQAMYGVRRRPDTGTDTNQWTRK